MTELWHVRMRRGERLVAPEGVSRAAAHRSRASECGQDQAGILQMAQLAEERTQGVLQRAVVGQAGQRRPPGLAHRDADGRSLERAGERLVAARHPAGSRQALGDLAELHHQPHIRAADHGQRPSHVQPDVRARDHHRHRG